MKGFFERVYDLLRIVPKGKVVTYGQIAYMIGNPKAARQVGYALHSNPKPIEIPCHRVVDRFGRLTRSFAFGGIEVQAALLREEGVEIDKDFQVDLQKYLWSGIPTKD